MKKTYKPIKTRVSMALVSVMTTGGLVHAAAFSLYGESSAYTVGNYAAGAAAEAVDASIGWYNPAGLSLIRDQQVVVGGSGVFTDIKISGTSTYTTEGLPPYMQSYEHLDGSYSGFIPALHYALPLGDHTTAGLSVTAPWGLSTDWAPNSAVRYSATYTELVTGNISPEIGTQLLENWAVGAGMDFQYARVKFDQMVGVPTLFDVLGENPASVDSLSKNNGSSWGLGYHVGIMGMFNENHTRIGVNYLSSVRHLFYGHSELKGPLANDFDLVGPVPDPGVWKNNNQFSNPIEFPDVLTLSAYQDVTERFALLGSVIYTGWSSFKLIVLNDVAAPDISSTPPFAVTQGNLISEVPQNYSDAWRASLGANYRVNSQWLLRVGGGYDQTPSNNTDRNIRLPDVDHWAVAVGAHYQMRPNIGFDVGYTHLFSASNPSVNNTQALSPTSSYNVNFNGGTFAANLVGAQVVWTIDKVVKPAPMK